MQVIQKLVFPFSRMNYRPSNHSELFPKLEAILEQKAGSSPLATVNILMSMFQLSHFPQTVLHQVFSPAFITNVMSMSGPFRSRWSSGLGWGWVWRCWADGPPQKLRTTSLAGSIPCGARLGAGGLLGGIAVSLLVLSPQAAPTP